MIEGLMTWFDGPVFARFLSYPLTVAWRRGFLTVQTMFAFLKNMTPRAGVTRIEELHRAAAGS